MSSMRLPIQLHGKPFGMSPKPHPIDEVSPLRVSSPYRRSPQVPAMKADALVRQNDDLKQVMTHLMDSLLSRQLISPQTCTLLRTAIERDLALNPTSAPAVRGAAVQVKFRRPTPR